MTDEPTTIELIATSAGLMLLLRRIIEQADRNDGAYVSAALDAIHEHLAVCGGSMMVLADHMGIAAEVDHADRGRGDRLRGNRIEDHRTVRGILRAGNRLRPLHGAAGATEDRGGRAACGGFPAGAVADDARLQGTGTRHSGR